MSRPYLVSAIFAACIAMGLLAAAWIGFAATDLERTSREKAALEENVRVALWRLESALVPLISRENGRPPAVYNVTFPADRAYRKDNRQYESGAVLLASPLQTETTPDVHLHFQIDAQGTWSSPQDMNVQLIESDSAAADNNARELLTRLSSGINRDELRRALPDPGEPAPLTPDDIAAAVASRSWTQQSQAMQIGQTERNDLEQQRRVQQVANQSASNLQPGLLPNGPMTVGPMRGVWWGEELLLARRVHENGGEVLQGCWLDWPAIRKRLLAEISDLFPTAALSAVRADAPLDMSRTLVSLPLLLNPGPTAVAVTSGGSPLRLSLLIAWSAMAVATIAVGALLIGTLLLSERRAAFVSAVTHELRTPLTTFRLYTDLLSTPGEVDPARQRSYAETLSAEARRLSHLVENVLTYARLERGRSTATLESIALRALLERIRPGLEQRASQAGLALVLCDVPGGESPIVRTDPAAVERILLNLVDNACKYAEVSEPRLIRIDTDILARRVRIRVRDYGPGIAGAARRRLFRPFTRPAGATTPGVGLGLALSRRLARHIGGELRHIREITDGAGFSLDLQRAIQP